MAEDEVIGRRPLRARTPGERPLPATSGGRFAFQLRGQSPLNPRDLGFQPGQLPSLFARRRGDPRRGVAVIAGATVFGDAVEVGVELVILTLRQWIELVVVAARAAHSQAKEERGGGVHAINHVLDRVLLRYDAVF